jgi:serine/threonine protein phosphatase PrpC
MLEDRGCWVLADGSGEQGGGAKASQLAVDTILQRFRSFPEVSTSALESYIGAANEAILDHQSSDGVGRERRSTVVAMLADAMGVLWGHVGNSRLYHFRGGRLIAQTKDHSDAQALADAGEISPSRIRFHPGRGSLHRILGKAGGAQPAILREPIEIHYGDAFLLATGGFWEFVSETEMEVELSKALTPYDWLRTMELRLRDKVSRDHDNYSAVGIFVPGGIDTTM